MRMSNPRLSNPIATCLDVIEALVSSIVQRPSRRPLDDLEQALRGAAREHQELQAALAHATIAERREADRLAALNGEIAELEGRAILAIQGGRQDLAERAAESLARLESQQVAQSGLCAEARSTAQALRRAVDANGIRLQKLNQGRQLARIRAIAPPLAHESHTHESHIAQAEDLLATVNATQAVMASDGQAQQITRELAEAGFGPSHQSEVTAILERLKIAAQSPETIKPIPVDLAALQRPSQL
jgi:phage shock protein A